MSVADAKYEIELMGALDTLRNSGASDELLGRIENGLKAMHLINASAAMLQSSADKDAARNYVALTMVGLHAPFERLVVELVKPGKRHSSDVCEEYHSIVCQVLDFIDAVTTNAADPSDPAMVVADLAKLAAHARKQIAELTTGHGRVGV